MKNEKLETIVNWNNTDKTIAVGVSGGEDSMCLLHFLHAKGQRVVAITVNHQIRESGKDDADFVESFCAKHNIPCLRFDVDVPAFAKENKMGLEEAARKCRYEIFNSVLKKRKADAIALGHHVSDQTETVLLNIFRGCGLKGLAGMSERENFIRPFLNVSKDEISTYVASNNVPHVLDETNTNTAYSRNFVRHEIMPKILEKFPAFQTTLQALSQNAKEAERYFRMEAKKYLKFSIFNSQFLIQIPLYAFSLPAPLPSFLLLESLNVLDAAKDVERKHIVEILAKVPKSQGGVFYQLPHKTVIERRKSMIYVIKDHSPVKDGE